ncbi:MAG: hypothetical protein HZB47_01030 [Nitrosomonadales bacterium]|nr:hypothetical protein [Nitrosomonadales bacterium]
MPPVLTRISFLGADEKERQSVYRALFRPQLDGDAIDDIRLALNQSQSLGNERFYQHIQQMTGQRREGKLRGRPRKASEGEGITGEQGVLEL